MLTHKAEAAVHPASPQEVERRITSRRADKRFDPGSADSKQYEWFIRAVAECHLTPTGAAGDMVVMLTAMIGGDPSVGAGIVTGTGDGRLVIATADHVIRRGTAAADKVSVTFPAWPRNPVEGTVLPPHDARLDLGAVAVSLQTQAGQGSTSLVNLVSRYQRVRLPERSYGTDFQFNNNRYALSSEELKRGTSVAVIGNPGGRPWFRPQQNGLLYSVDENEILFEQLFLTPGFSGGALLDSKGR